MTHPLGVAAVTVGAGIVALHLPSPSGLDPARALVPAVIKGLAPFLPLVALVLAVGVVAVLTAPVPLWRDSRARGWSIYAVAAAAGFVVATNAAQRWQSHLLPAACERQLVSFAGQVMGLSKRIEGREEAFLTVSLQLRKPLGAGCRGPQQLRLYLPVTALLAVGADSVRPGDEIAGEARLRRPWGYVNPHAASGERYQLIQGVHAVGSIAKLHRYHVIDDPPVLQSIHRVRAAVAAWITQGADATAAPLLTALAVGDRRGMGAEHWDVLRTYGLTHLLVISGLHVSLIAVPGWWLGRGLGLLLSPLAPSGSRYLPVLSALSAAGLYSCLAGLALPTMRAMLILGLAALPRMRGRPIDHGRLLGACAIALFLWEPLSLLSASFWLSLGAVGLILWVSLWPGEGGFSRRLLSLQYYLLIAMMPLSLFWFASASGPGAVINLLAIPLVTWVLLPALLGAILIFISNLSYSTYLIDIISLIASISWDYLLAWRDYGVGAGTLETSPKQVLLVVGVVGVLLLGVRYLPLRHVIAVALLAPLLGSIARPPRVDVDVHFLDVGQGTAVLIRQGRRVVLYDTGASAAPGRPRIAGAVTPLLRALQIHALDLLVVSHEDDDHAGGADYVRREYSPRRSLYGGPAHAPGESCRTGLFVDLGPGLWLRSLSVALPGDTDNNGSCVILVHAHGRRILLPGDIDTRREAALVAYWSRELRADVLMAAHHGANTSTSRLWLRTVDPRLVVITSGRANRFGHPGAKVLKAIREHGAVTLSTATDGAISLRISRAGEIRCHRARHRWGPFWQSGQNPKSCGVMVAP